MASDLWVTTNKVMGEDWKKCGTESTTESTVIKTRDCDTTLTVTAATEIVKNVNYTDTRLRAYMVNVDAFIRCR